MRIFFRNGHYYTRFLNAVFQTPSVFDLAIQGGPGGLGWDHYKYIEKSWHRIRTIEKNALTAGERKSGHTLINTQPYYRAEREECQIEKAGKLYAEKKRHAEKEYCA